MHGEPVRVIERGGALAIRIYAPTADDAAWTLVTDGMRARPMAVPDAAVPSAIELAIRLPAAWAADAAAFDDPARGWPMRWLDTLARLPGERATYLALGHTIPNGDPPQPLAPGTRLAGVMLVSPTFADADDVLAVMPLYPGELQLKLERGADELLARLDAAELDETFDLARPDVAITPTPTGPKIRHSKRRTKLR